MLPIVTPQLVGNTGLRALRAAIAEPERFACEPKVDGVRGLVVYGLGSELGLVAQAFDVPLELSPVVEPSRGLALDMADGRLEGIVLKDRTSPYRDDGRAGWFKIKDRWYEREAWRFDRR